jgi:hypothetical protein
MRLPATLPKAFLPLSSFLYARFTGFARHAKILKMQINIPELLCFFDARPENSRGHASAIVSVIGEDIGVALLRRCVEKKWGVSTKVIMNGEVALVPTLGTGRGPRLDRWLLSDDATTGKRTLYQVEIKNWSAHSLGGKEIPSGTPNDSEFMKGYRLERWQANWDISLNCFRWGECGKVLTRMAIPTSVYEDGKVIPISPPVEREDVEPILCFWSPIHHEGQNESLFRYPLSSVPESGFTGIWIFSMSNYLRSIVENEQVIDLDMPSAARRIEWLSRLCPE